MNVAPECCRICLKVPKNPSSLFLTSYGDTHLCDLLSEVIGFKVDVEKTLPQQICDLCMSQLIAFYEFKRMCCTAEISLQASLFEKQPQHQQESSVVHPEGSDIVHAEEKIDIKIEDIKVDFSEHSYSIGFVISCLVCHNF